MNDYRGKYKRKSGGGNDPDFGRIFRTEQHEERRKVMRAEYYSRHRDLSDSPEIQEKIQQDPITRLRKWQLEKALKKKLEQRKKKPAFKVGVVHHHFYSPVQDEKSKAKPIPCHGKGARRIKPQPSPPKRITRATLKRLEAKKNAATPTPGKRIVNINTPKERTRTAKKNAATSTPGKPVIKTNTPNEKVPRAKKNLGMSFAPENYTFKGPAGIEEIPMFGKFINRDSVVDKQDLAEEISAELNKPWPDSKLSFHIRSSQSKQRNSFTRQMAVDLSNSSVEKEPPQTEDSSDEKSDYKNVDPEPELVTINTHCNGEMDSNSLETPPRTGSPAPALFSPYITTSRGKDSARRERRSKMGIGRTTPDEIPTKETIMQSLNISVEEEERTAQYFKFLLQREVDRLNGLCAKWEGMKNEPDITEDGLYFINQAVGQTNLLIKKKFERFRGLVLDCESGKGEMLVRCRDLQGFWDLMHMEVKNCDSRFEKLENLRSKSWIEDEIVMAVKKPTGIKKKVAASKFAGNAKSSVRSWILEKKKKMAQTEQISEDGILVKSGHRTSVPSEINEETTADKAFNSRRSIKSSPSAYPQARVHANLKATPNRTPASLLKKVQLSQARKSIHSPLAVMKISKMCKTPEIHLDDTISYVNSDQTPQRSILKKSSTEDSFSANDTAITKSNRKVDFNDDVIANEAEEVDENLENSIDLGRALARIDSYNSDDSSDEIPESPAVPLRNVTVRRIEKRLDFENESFNETENTETGECSNNVVAAIPNSFELPIVNVPESRSSKPSQIPIIHVTEATPSKTDKTPMIYVTEATPPPPSSTSRSTRSRRRTGGVADSSIQEDQPTEDQTITRVLRNRIVPANTPGKTNRKSNRISESSKLDLDFDSSTKENENPRASERKINSSMSSSKIIETEDSDDKLAKRRRSTRKSVRFNADDCTGCVESSKPVHPMTPHSRRTRKISLLADDSRQSVVPFTNGDLMSFDSPASISIPPRVRRTSGYTKKTSKQ
ncbi:uncharacterized protein [Venturia canescens]|uniref:uncharacterized protein n=1 Tax=Venturia canescens TaxID=32260 RepID=UPI001C9CD89F|nr:uncharacterized protein LOC122406742 [Venturia canescens]